MKFSKKLKAMAAAIAVLTLSAASAVTGTVAWFTANNLVNVSGMNIQAEAEQGIVVSNEAKSLWKTSATASHSGADAQCVPTSTSTTTTWYHGFASNAANGQEYESIAVISPVDNVTTPTAYGTANDGIFGFLDTSSWKNVYLLNSFYIQSSSINAINGQNIFVRDFEAKVGENAPAQELSKSLRVAVIKHGGATPVIVAPVSGADASYEVGPVGSKTSFTATTTTNVDTLTVDANVNIPAYDANGANALQYDVFVYFEGEDAACMSNNIVASLEQLSVSFKFGNKAAA